MDELNQMTGIDGQELGEMGVPQPVEENADTTIDTTIDPKEAYSKYILPAKLSDSEKAEVILIIENEMGKIKSEYADVQYYEKIRKNREEWGGEPDGTETYGRPDIKLQLAKLTESILTSRAVRQTVSGSPLVLLEKEDTLDDDALTDRADALDFELRHNVKVNELFPVIYKYAAIDGVSIMKIPFVYEMEYYTKVESYEPAEIEKFEQKYGEYLTDPKTKEFKNWLKLQSGESITIPVDSERIIHNGAKPYRVDYEKFYARPKIKDFRKHVVISEQHDFTWYDIEMRERTGFYDKKAVEQIKEKSEDYATKSYTFFESIVLWDRKSNGRPQRYVVTYDAETRVIVKAIFYPYEEVCYVDYSLFPHDDTWIGESIISRIVDVIATANSVLNSAVYEQDLAHTPLILTSDPRAMTKKTITLGEVNVVPFQTNSNFSQVKFELPSTDRIAFLNWLIDFIGLLTGVDASLLSGAETPEDPRAPAAKTAMKLSATNMRIEDMIINLQLGDARMAKQVEYIKYKFTDGKTVKWYDNKKEDFREIEKDIFETPVRYVIHGSKMSFSKSMDLQIVMQTMEIIGKFFPSIWADYEVQEAILKSILNLSGGSVEKMKDTIIEPLSSYLEMQKVMKAIKGGGQNPGQNPGQNQGQTPGQNQQTPGQNPNIPQGQPEEPSMEQIAQKAMNRFPEGAEAVE